MKIGNLDIHNMHRQHSKGKAFDSDWIGCMHLTITVIIYSWSMASTKR